MKLNYGTMALACIGLVLLVLYERHAPWDSWRIVGVCLGTPSLLLLLLARVQLGSAFSVRAKASKLVTTGIYSHIRNPIYTFGIASLASLAIFAHKPWLLLFLLVIFPLQVIRSRNEERILTEEFGAEYLAYKRKTWF